MLFNSPEYFIFLPIVFILYWFLFSKSVKNQNILILIASYCFYGWWSWKFLFLLAISTIVDYLFGFAVASDNKKKAKLFLKIALINNLGILGIFKYYNFFADQIRQGAEMIGMHLDPIILQIALPIGISFYTFHGISYVFDIYRGTRKPVKNFIEYAVFVCFFPLLVAGPIERANHLLPQVQTKRFFRYTQAVEGCKLILWGMFKKVVVADTIAISVDEIFGHYQIHSSTTLILGAIGYTFQIYCDFSGYTDIAIGSAKLLGFELLSNFKFPFFSRNVAEFWRKWHISLTSWFRDYLYIPLGGSKNGKNIVIRNTFIIFIVSGLWHGANWTFILWGLINAIGFLPLLLFNKNRMYVNEIIAENKTLPTLKEFFQMLTTFGFIAFSKIFFRSQSVTDAFRYIQRIFTNHNHPGEFLFYINIVYVTAPFIVLDWWFRKDERKLKMPHNKILRYILYFLFTMIILSTLFLREKDATNFIYFQF